MPEGLSPSEVGKEIAEQRHKAHEQGKERGEAPATEPGVILVFCSISLIVAPKPGV